MGGGRALGGGQEEERRRRSWQERPDPKTTFEDDESPPALEEEEEEEGGGNGLPKHSHLSRDMGRKNLQTSSSRITVTGTTFLSNHTPQPTPYIRLHSGSAARNAKRDNFSSERQPVSVSDFYRSQLCNLYCITLSLSLSLSLSYTHTHTHTHSLSLLHHIHSLRIPNKSCEISQCCFHTTQRRSWGSFWLRQATTQMQPLLSCSVEIRSPTLREWSSTRRSLLP